MSELRRYEILVPLLFNDGQPVPESLLALTFTELRRQFGDLTRPSTCPEGIGCFEGTEFW